MKTIYFILLGTSLFFTACDSSIVFNAKFESDAVGSAPNLDPAETPEGDLIYTSNSCNSAAGDLIVENNPTIGSKALKFKNVGVADYCRILGFISITVDMSVTDELWFYWSGVYNPTSDMVPLDLWVGNSHFMSLGSIRFQNGNVYRAGPGATPVYTSIGTFTPGELHTIIFHVNEATMKWSVTINKHSGNINSGELDILNPTAFSTTKYGIYASFTNYPANSNSNYFMDNVFINKKNP